MVHRSWVTRTNHSTEQKQYQSISAKHNSELKDYNVSQDRNDDSGLNPVELYAGVARTIRSYTLFFNFFDGSSFFKISGREILRDICSCVYCIGGYCTDVGDLSFRNSLEMIVTLAKEPTYTIMLIGCWSSDAFLSYIENQIKEFTKGFSSRMLTNRTFYNTHLARRLQ